MAKPFEDGEIEGVVVKALEVRTDERGWLAEIFRSDDMSPDLIPAMAYVSVTGPGLARGPHEHLLQTDVFCFLGRAAFEVRMWDNRPGSPTYRHHQSLVVAAGSLILVIIPPGVVHGYRNVGNVEGMMINLPNRLFRGRGRSEPVDEIRSEDDPGSPFKLEP